MKKSKKNPKPSHDLNTVLPHLPGRSSRKKKHIMQKFSLFCCKMCIFLKKKWQNKIAIIPF